MSAPTRIPGATAPPGVVDDLDIGPLANWSRFVLPTQIAPAASRRSTIGADRAGA